MCSRAQKTLNLFFPKSPYKMKNAPFRLDSDAILPFPDNCENNFFPTSFQEQLLNVYWIKKDIEETLQIDRQNINDSLTDVSQLLSIIETKILRILKKAAKSDADLQNYWGF